MLVVRRALVLVELVTHHRGALLLIGVAEGVGEPGAGAAPAAFGRQVPGQEDAGIPLPILARLRAQLLHNLIEYLQIRYQRCM